MTPPQFSQYRPLLAELAQRFLLQGQAQALAAVTSDAATAPAAMPSTALALPAAWLLLAPQAELYPQLAAGFKRLAALAHAPAAHAAGPIMVPDLDGARRDIHHPLVLHLHLSAFLRCFELLPAATWGICEEALPAAVEVIRGVEEYTTRPPPPQDLARVLWQNLCLFEQAQALSRDVDLELVDAITHACLTSPGPGGSLHPIEADQSLDSWTYQELCGLHALANLALARRNQSWSRRVQEITAYHLENTQPDHTTTQPWAVFAFLWSGVAAPFAQQQLHDAQTQSHSAGRGALLCGLLLADACCAIQQFRA